MDTAQEAAPQPGPEPCAQQTPLTSLASVALPAQLFSGSPLNRAQDTKRRFDGALSGVEVALIPIAGREVAFRLQDVALGPGGDAAAAGPTHDLQMLLLSASDPQLDLNSDFICLLWYKDEAADDLDVQRLPLYLLGKDIADRWTFALDVSGPNKPAFMQFLRTTCGLPGVELADLRTLMPHLSPQACAIAGQAAALSQWHLTNRYCARCGGPTLPCEAGVRRRCEADHKAYPRTDPVVIMLVESPDGSCALLGRNRKFTPGMYTCLSGFIDQCESIEEAVRREVLEEARVAVTDVQIVSTQPWPIGRYGSCELMLGCVAKARGYEILVNKDEMEDVQWYSREDLLKVLELYDGMAGAALPDLQAAAMRRAGFFIPPPFAIAHHLIRAWAQHDGPWFPPPPPTQATSHL